MQSGRTCRHPVAADVESNAAHSGDTRLVLDFGPEPETLPGVLNQLQQAQLPCVDLEGPVRGQRGPRLFPPDFPARPGWRAGFTDQRDGDAALQLGLDVAERTVRVQEI